MTEQSSSFAWRQELGVLARLGLPAAALFALRTAQLLTDQAVVGHLRAADGRPTALYLDAASQALLWMNLSLQAFLRGLGGAINTLCANAIGAGNHSLAGTWLHVGVLCGTASAAFLGMVWMLVAPALARLVAEGGEAASGEVDPDDVATLAAEYARLSVAWLLPTFWMESLSTWLTSQQIVLPQLCVYAVFFLVNLGANVALVHGVAPLGLRGLGFRGSPLATAATRAMQFCALLLLVRARARAARGPQLPSTSWAEALRAGRPRTFAAQAVPRVLSAALEELCLAVVGVLAARLGAVAMATHNAMLMAFFWLTSPMYGLTTASVVRIGRHLGANNVAAARGTARLCVVAAMSLGLAIAATLVGARSELGLVFSQDRAVVAMVAAIAPLAGGAYTLIGLFYSSMAILNGQGRPLPVALAFLLGAFVLAPGLGWVLTYVAGCCGTVRLYGLWLGLIGGYLVTTAIAGGAALCSDWPALAKQAALRSESTTHAAHAINDGGCAAAAGEHAAGADAGTVPDTEGGTLSRPLLPQTTTRSAAAVEREAALPPPPPGWSHCADGGYVRNQV